MAFGFVFRSCFLFPFSENMESNMKSCLASRFRELIFGKDFPKRAVSVNIKSIFQFSLHMFSEIETHYLGNSKIEKKTETENEN